MTWCLGVLVLLAWHSLLIAHGATVTWSFLDAVMFWLFVGAGALIMGLVRLLAGKMKAGAPVLGGTRGPGAPVTTKSSADSD
jgi:hypothetical protein